MSIYSGPWTASAEDPIDWALRTGRITDRSCAQWRAMYGGDPVGVGRTLAGLQSVLASSARLGRLEADAERHAQQVEDEAYAAMFGPVPDDGSGLVPDDLSGLVDDGENFDHLFPPR